MPDAPSHADASKENPAHKEKGKANHKEKEDKNHPKVETRERAIRDHSKSKNEGANKASDGSRTPQHSDIGTRGKTDHSGKADNDVSKEALSGSKLRHGNGDNSKVKQAHAASTDGSWSPKRLDLTTRGTAPNRESVDLNRVQVSDKRNPTQKPTEVADRKERESSERQLEYSAPNTVGFATGKFRASQNSLDNFLNQTPGAKENISNPNVTWYLTGMASRKGSDSSNQKLSKDRAEDVAALLRKSGVKGKIEIDAIGSTHSENLPKDDDRPSERIVLINFDAKPETSPEKVERGDVGQALEALKRTTLLPPTDHNTDQVKDILGNGLKEGLKEFVNKTIETGGNFELGAAAGLKEAAKEIGKEGGKLTAKKTIEFLKENKMLAPLVGNYVAGIQDRLAQMLQSESPLHQGYYFNPSGSLYAAGRQVMENMRGKMTSAEWKNIENVSRDPPQYRAMQQRFGDWANSEVNSNKRHHLGQ